MTRNVLLDLLQTHSLEEANRSLAALGTALDTAWAVNPETGTVTVDDEALASAVADTLPVDVGAGVLRDLREIATDGFVVRDSQRLFPWKLVTDPSSAAALGPGLQVAGFPSNVAPDRWGLELLARFPDAPPQALDPQVADSVDQTLALAPQRDNDPETDDRGGGPQAIIASIQELVGCFIPPRATWELPGWGVRIGLGPACARGLGAALTGASAPALIAGLQAAFAAGGTIAAALAAGAAAAGGWVVLGIAANAFITGNLINLATTENGAWIVTSWLGPIVWAEPR
jgi:hypothetical protein